MKNKLMAYIYFPYQMEGGPTTPGILFDNEEDALRFMWLSYRHFFSSEDEWRGAVTIEEVLPFVKPEWWDLTPFKCFMKDDAIDTIIESFGADMVTKRVVYSEYYMAPHRLVIDFWDTDLESAKVTALKLYNEWKESKK